MFETMPDKAAFRLSFDLLFAVALIVLPWWASAIALLLPLFYFGVYYEAILAGVLLDALYAAPTAFFGGFAFFHTTLFMTLLFVSLSIKGYIRTT